MYSPNQSWVCIKLYFNFFKITGTEVTSKQFFLELTITNVRFYFAYLSTHIGQMV